MTKRARYNEDTPKSGLDIKSEICALLKKLNCTYEETAGIVYVTTPDGYVWDFTVPMERAHTAFLQLNDRVRAKTQVFDLPGNPDPGCIHAEPGELGTVVHVQIDHWPTVRFDRTGTATCVTDAEVEKIDEPGGDRASTASV